MSMDDPIATGDAATAPASATASEPSRRRPGLGRGLSALLADTGRGRALPPDGSAGDVGAGVAGQGEGAAARMIAVARITPLPGQPRRRFDPDAMTELTESVRARGVLQPILVRPHPDGTGYQLVAGERRWRAAQAAGRHEIPAVVRALDDGETHEIALVENIQRADLSAVEEARGYARLIADYGHPQEALARLVGKSRSHVTNLLRLLTLPDAVQEMVDGGALQMGHARALIGHADAESLARRAVAEGLSVRRVEALAKERDGGAAPPPAKRATRAPAAAPGGADGLRDDNLIAVEQHLSDLLGLGVVIQPGSDGSGQLTVSFRSLDQLDMVCQRLSGGRI